MQSITKFKSKDGKEFNSAQECLKYEDILERVEDILKHLPSYDDISFSNGEGYIQHERGVKQSLEKDIVALANKYFAPKEPYTQFNYYLGRIIDDSGMRCLNSLTYKIMCIDDLNREWGQPYFAINPDKGIQKQLN